MMQGGAPRPQNSMKQAHALSERLPSA